MVLKKTIVSSLMASFITLSTLASNCGEAALIQGKFELGGDGSALDAFGYGEYPGIATFFLCVAILPLCLYGKGVKSNHPGAISAKELYAQGYSQKEVALIFKDQSRLSQKLRKSKQKFSIQAGETYASLTRRLRALDSTVSQTYLKFVGSELGFEI